MSCLLLPVGSATNAQTGSDGGSIWCEVPELGLVEFPPAIQRHFQHYQQTGKKDKEAGGQLFWKYADDGHILVGAITGPRPTDKRSRTGYKADHKQEQLEIDHFYGEGLYLLGDWHTHPEPVASPSSLDVVAIQQIYRSSKTLAQVFFWQLWERDRSKRA